MKEWLEAQRGKLRMWNRERKERAAERKHEKQMAALRDQHAHSRFWLLNVPALATICAAVVEWYWAVLFCIEATGQLGMDWSTSVGSDVQAAGAWHFLFDIQNMWVLIGLILATMPIVMLSMIWLPVQFAMRGAGRWRRGSLIAVGLLANVLVIVSGTVVMNYNRQDQVREALVVEQTAQQGRAAIQAQIDAVNTDLARLTDRRVNNEYAANAANVGAEAYRRSYMSPEALARSPVERRDIIVRALGAAEQADALRAQRTALIGQLAAAPTEAAVASNVQDNVGRELNTFAQYVEVWRPPFVAFICTLIGIFGAWWTLAMLERLNPKDVLRSGWADDGHRIEDLRADEPVKAQPMRPAREVVTDAETGEELVKVKPREYWRKRKGKPQRVQFDPEIPPDETGVEVDGANRQAVSGAVSGSDVVEPNEPQEIGEMPSEPPAAPSEFNVVSAAPDDENVHPEPSTDDLIALHALADDLAPLTDTPVLPEDQGEQDQHSDEPQAEPVAEQSDEETDHERQPETDPTRLIAAE